MADSGIGKNVKRLRLEHGMTQGELGEKLGIDRKHVSKIENDTMEPRRALRDKLCDVFAIDEMTLRLGERKEEKPQTPEHLRLLFEMIAEVFPTSSDLVQKSEVLSKVMRDLRDGK